MPPRDAPDPVARTTAEFLLDIRGAAIGQAHRRTLAALTGIDVPRTELWALHAIPGLALVPVSQVAEDLDISLPAASRACASLERKGHLIRIADPRDGRRTLVGLTDSAAKALVEWQRSWPAPYLALVESWPDEDVRCLRDWMHRVVESWDAKSVGAYASGASSKPALDAFSTTVERLVSTAGRADLLEAALQRHAPDLSPILFHTLRAVAAAPDGLSIRELAARYDVDRALARRRSQTLATAGLVDTSGSGGAVRATRTGRRLIRQVTDKRASQLPEVPGELRDRGLDELISSFVNRLRESARTPNTSGGAASHPVQGMG